jgi:hypothetical protein
VPYQFLTIHRDAKKKNVQELDSFHTCKLVDFFNSAISKDTLYNLSRKKFEQPCLCLTRVVKMHSEVSHWLLL